MTKELHVDRHGFVRQRKNGSMAVKIVDSDSTDSFKLRENLVALGRLLRPMKAIGYTKRRFGTRHQGGYVMLDDFKGIAAAFSLGVSSNVDWDMEVANRDIPVYQFGNSIEDVIIRHSRFKFYQGAIGPAKGQISFDALATEYAGEPLETASAIMKMDIEHDEWATLAAAAPKNLRKLRQFVVELHCMDLIAHPRWWLQAQAVLAKLHEEFCVVHVHGNVSGGALMVGGVPFPNVLEVTFASRHHYTFEETDELFPTPLDASCDPRLPDLYLGSFKF